MDWADFWHGGFFWPVLHCYKEIWVTPKIRVLPSGTLSHTLDLENFATASRWLLGVVSKAVDVLACDKSYYVVSHMFLSCGEIDHCCRLEMIVIFILSVECFRQVWWPRVPAVPQISLLLWRASDEQQSGGAWHAVECEPLHWQCDS